MSSRPRMSDPELEHPDAAQPSPLAQVGDDLAELEELEESDSDPALDPEESSHSLALLAGLAVFTVLAFTLYGSVLDLGFLGWDSFPMIWSSRCDGLGDMLSLFRSELMDGLYTDGSFYRPTTSLSFALNEAFSALDARGYHLFDLGLPVASSVLLVALGRRLAVVPATLAGAVAGLVFLLHPVQLALLPVPPRRADALSLALLLACLYVQRDEEEPRSRAFPVGLALLAFLASGAKESGTLVVLLVPILHLARGQRPLHTLVSSLPVVIGVGAYLLLRSIVLPGLGGHAESGLAALRHLPELAGPYADRVLGTGTHGHSPTLRAGLTIASSAAILAASFVALWRPGAGPPADRRRQRGALVLIGLWMLAELALASLAGRLHDWYALQLVAPFALLLGLLFATGARLLRDGRLALVPLLLPLPVVLSLLMPLGSYRERSLRLWHEADDLTRELLERTVEAVDAHPIAAQEPGQVVIVEGLVPLLNASGLPPLAVLSDYSVAAYLRLVRPERAVAVELLRPGVTPEPAAEVLTLLLAPPR